MKTAFSRQTRIARLGALLSAGIGLALAAPGAAQAQAGPAERGRDPIVVQGERLSRSAAVDEKLVAIKSFQYLPCVTASGKDLGELGGHLGEHRGTKKKITRFRAQSSKHLPGEIVEDRFRPFASFKIA